MSPKLNAGKAIRQDKIPPTLIKMATESLSTSLSIVINKSFKYNIFPSNAKVACVKPLDKDRRQTLYFKFSTSEYFKHLLKDLRNVC